MTSEGKRDKNNTTDTGNDHFDNELANNLKKIKKELGNSSDLIVRKFTIGDDLCLNAAAIYMDGLVDEKTVNEFVLESIKVESSEEGAINQKNVFEFINTHAISVGEVKVIQEWNTLILAILSGHTAILVDGCAKILTGNTKGGETRQVSEPTSQLVIRGPKEAFTESIGTNAALIRRRIKTPNLWLETMQIGSTTQTDVALMYIKGVANEKVLKETKKRLGRIDIDGILESGYIEQLIQDHPYSPFPTIYNTERPDAIVGNLLEGRIAILVDGTPFVLVIPALFIQFFQSPADYYQQFFIGSFLRLLRLSTYIITLLTPALYIALTTFHPQMIPTRLLISLAAQNEGVPFPLFVEVMLMEITFEILREAGVRMPRAVGQAVSIVGGLVLGQAAVQAGIVSAATVIVVSLTGIASFAFPSYTIGVPARLLRFLMMILAGSLGLYGVAMALFILVAHLSSLRSFGIPYLSPFAPFVWSDIKDTLVRQPLWSLLLRPKLINQQNLKRQDKSQKPTPPDTDNSA
ncbi:spore germination protein [Halobacillus shinanisalinarum]|uniref:Spore germination protein n=1 Tax=Halobacillus shinanisalinarum TaxID=2932258 RepID=A0ABY4H3D7_9BACI|nr:spore germination protein [Halobacillus shinanisalinarum]UOQ94634.1 spore germination protein [Halobacillus shinanisalinarum]